MRRVFLFSSIGLTILVVLTSPPLVRPILYPQPSPTATFTPEPATPTATATLDPFANVPTATLLSQSLPGAISARLPTPVLGAPPATFTPQSTSPPMPATGTLLLPNPLATPAPPVLSSWQPSAALPIQLQIPRLKLELPVEPVGLVPSTLGPDLTEPALPPAGMVGGLIDPANSNHTIVVFAPNDFQELMTLEAGEELRLSGEHHLRSFVVAEILSLPQVASLEARLANARHLQPKGEQLTLIIPTNKRTIVVVARKEG